MRQAVGTIVVTVLCAGSVGHHALAAPPAGVVSPHEFGLTPKQLTQAIEKVEMLISKCMREQGFEYVAADFLTIRAGMNADKTFPGLNSEEEFIRKYGLGMSTLYTGLPPQEAPEYTPQRIGLGEKNIQIYKNLSPADRVAYNRALFGDRPDKTFSFALEREDFEGCGGCTMRAIEQVFAPEQLKTTYFNPHKVALNKDPRMRAALKKYADGMRKAGFTYEVPEQVGRDIRARLAALTNGGKLRLEDMTPAQQAALKELQTYEVQAAYASFQLYDKILDPIEEAIEKEWYGDKAQGMKARPTERRDASGPVKK
jgi:hypothetical protein